VKEEVIIVDENDRPVGTMEKLEAHQKGMLHRAFSVIVFNSKKEILLQQRALNKYHSPGLWTNTCCSHPRPGEDTLAAAKRRLNEEMGLTLELEHQFSFIYRTDFDNGLTEHELDHVYFCYTDAQPVINTEEANDFKWLSFEVIQKEIKQKPESFSSWFKLVIQKMTEF
jgi:isopentenyl-diphosphate Delta-isomerase